MTRGIVALFAALVVCGCGSDDERLRDAVVLQVQPQVLAEGLNYPTALSYVSSNSTGLESGSVVVGLSVYGPSMVETGKE